MEVIVAEIHTEMTENTGALGAHTTMIDQSLWQQGSQHLEQSKAEVSPDQMTDATTTVAVEETVDMTVGSHAAMDTEGKNGGGQTEARRKTQ